MGPGDVFARAAPTPHRDDRPVLPAGEPGAERATAVVRRRPPGRLRLADAAAPRLPRAGARDAARGLRGRRPQRQDDARPADVLQPRRTAAEAARRAVADDADAALRPVPPAAAAASADADARRHDDARGAPRRTVRRAAEGRQRHRRADAGPRGNRRRPLRLRAAGPQRRGAPQLLPAHQLPSRDAGRRRLGRDRRRAARRPPDRARRRAAGHRRRHRRAPGRHRGRTGAGHRRPGADADGAHRRGADRAGPDHARRSSTTRWSSSRSRPRRRRWASCWCATGVVSREDLQTALARKMGYPLVDVGGVPGRAATRWRALPYARGAHASPRCR
ncbi:MAG: hypothetical protein MZW92_22770 [Comamonadaceae bacterium]|nr:hypothetical protein [Comamonadaceae bacterium]